MSDEIPQRDPQPNTPGGSWDEGRAPAKLPGTRPDDGVKEPPEEPGPDDAGYGSLDLPDDDPVTPSFQPAF